jgi:hypothetical protein
MPATRSGSAITAQPTKAVQPSDGTRQRRLAALLAGMMPGACIIRVSQHQPGRTWPSPYSRAYDERGQLMPLNRTQRVAVARWVIRAHPEVDWEEAHDLDLAIGTLRPAREADAPSGRER